MQFEAASVWLTKAASMSVRSYCWLLPTDLCPLPERLRTVIVVDPHPRLARDFAMGDIRRCRHRMNARVVITVLTQAPVGTVAGLGTRRRIWIEIQHRPVLRTKDDRPVLANVESAAKGLDRTAATVAIQCRARKDCGSGGVLAPRVPPVPPAIGRIDRR